MSRKKPAQAGRTSQGKERSPRAIAAGAFFAGLLVGAAAIMLLDKDSDAPLEVREGNYLFINPLLECEPSQESIRQQALLPFKQHVKKVIDEHKSRKTIREAAVYFRDLNNGPWFGVEERERFAPASLLKVVTMMTVLHAAEPDGQMLQRRLHHIPRTSPFRQKIIAAPPLKIGAAYTIDDLLHRMIAFSDNDAAFLLATFIGNDRINKLCRDIGVPSPDERKDYLLSVKEYASFFRILFNASYLNREMSERGLQYLSRSAFRSGIVAGVPSTVSVAHKFGEREFPAPDGSVKQLHDCGIVYYPEHPYLLCVMTRGRDFAELSLAIQDISRTIYHELQTQYE